MFTGGVFTATWERIMRSAAPDTTPRIEPVDPPAEVLAAMFAPPTDPGLVEVLDVNGFPLYPRPLAGYHAQETGQELAVLDDLADRIAGGMSPLDAARDRFPS